MNFLVESVSVELLSLKINRQLVFLFIETLLVTAVNDSVLISIIPNQLIKLVYFVLVFSGEPITAFQIAPLCQRNSLFAAFCLTRALPRWH